MSSAGHVLVTSRSFGTGSSDCAAELEATGLTVVRGPASHELAELRTALATAVAWIAGTGAVTDAHLAAAPRLRVIARYGVGYESVDLAAAASHGITVTNTPGANTAAVADHALGLILAAMRATVPGDRGVRSGRWAPIRGRELGSATVGLIGFGKIGQAAAQRLAGFGTWVLAHDLHPDVDAMSRLRVRPAALTELAACDIVSLHAAGDQCLIDDAWLALPGPPLTIVNTARAGLVDESAVAAAMRRGRVTAFAADTLTGEYGTAAASPLLAPELADRVVVTPHVGAQTTEAIDNMTTITTADVLAVLRGRPPRYPVTLQSEA